MAEPVEPLERLTVVVPVRDEEMRLPATLDHIRRAMDRVESGRRREARLVVVLDVCTDGSAGIATAAADADPRIRIITSDAGSVGVARSLGVATALAGIPPQDLHRQWIANTDADTRVPPDWLEVFADAADAGTDALVGTVEPDVLELGRHRYAAWQALHIQHEGHPHVHGANLGVRASAYRDAGGFQPVQGDEDVRLVEALRARGAVVRSSGRPHVVTSGRLLGRVGHGFAGYLAHLPDGACAAELVPSRATHFLDTAGRRT
ncbi:glycosyltransferase [Arthrobacter rhombi]|uniref:glycosyltransferase n=1 Tax=Arthrobacter rhombi TaxID=71253 RepID=UPI003FD3AA28